MTLWTFDSDAESWNTSDFVWDGGTGIPMAGCLYAAPGGYANVTFVSTSESVTEDDTCFFYFRVAGVGGLFSSEYLRVRMILTSSIFQDYTVIDDSSIIIPAYPGTLDTGWLQLSGTIPFTGDLREVAILFTSDYPSQDELSVWIDYVFVDTGEGPPPPFDANEFTHSSGGIPGSILVVT